MEIERKWLVDEFPSEDEYTCIFKAIMHQGYVATQPAVRIRKTQQVGKNDEFILCFKGKGTLVREEIELEIDKETFDKLCNFTGKNLVQKRIHKYKLKTGDVLEVNCVDEGTKNEFYYAEVEFDSVEKANAFNPPEILGKEMTEDENFSMRQYWIKTRGEA